MKITGITEQLKSDRLNIFIDGKYSFSLGLDDILTHKLKVGVEVDTALVNALKKISADGIVIQKAISWGAYQPRSSHDLKQYFFRKKIEKDLQPKISELLAKYGLLNDDQYQELKTSSLMRKNKSPRQIQAALSQKGIKSEPIKDKAYIEESLQKIIAKKTIRYKNDPLKIKTYLYSQGYSIDDINEALHKLTDS